MFDWTAYHTLAQELAVRPEEACKRAAISRAYYAVFCTARNLAERRKLVDLTHTGEDHGAVWRALENSPSRQLKECAEKGWRLLKRRHIADYDDEYPHIDSDLPYSISLADQALKTLKRV